MTSWMSRSRRRFISASPISTCCVESTTVSTRFGAPASYSTVTWDLPSGRISGNLPERRASASAFVSRCASWIGAGMSSGVSRTA